MASGQAAWRPGLVERNGPQPSDVVIVLEVGPDDRDHCQASVGMQGRCAAHGKQVEVFWAHEHPI